MALLTLLLIVTILVVTLVLNRIKQSKQNRPPIGARKLPGPRGLPLIGNVHELPEKNSWLKFHEWGEKYGPIYQVNLAGTNHVWISRDKIARDLLAKRSDIYSDRPFIPALEQDNRTSGQYLPLMSKNELWARQRRFAKHIMDKSEKAAFYGYPELESIRLLVEMMADPSRYNVAMESFIARVTSRLAWGTSTSSDELKQRARELLIGVSPAGALGNKLPFVMSLPEKLVAAKAWESRRSRTERKFFETMQQDVQAQMTNTTEAQPQQSWMRTFLERKTHWGFASDLEGAFAVGMHGIAGALTIAAPMQSFCLAMCHYPQYQSVLHEEIDRVLGDRMPQFSDMPDMPVLRAFIRETLRWRPPVPTGIPHELIRDDVYEGYHIPAGSVMHPLEWSISRDPEVFTDPEAWNPLRWLDPKYPTYQEPLAKFPTITGYSQFGYGRRVCQGMGVTEADLFVGLGSIAWLFSMHATDEAVVAGEKEPTDVHRSVETDESEGSVRSDDDRPDPISPAGWNTPADDAFDPQSTFDFEQARRKLMRHANDSAISVPGEFPVPAALADPLTPPQTPKTARPARSGTNAGQPDFPRVDEMFAAPPTPVSPSASPQTSHRPSDQADPTMDFSTLLIAKPMPFQFHLRIRSKRRAEHVASKWLDAKMEGEFADARVYWAEGRSVRGDAECGWGEVFA